MISMRRALLALAAIGMTGGLGGCVGSYGYASDYYGAPAYSPGSRYYGGLGGWYDDFYYPGTGVYVFDRSGRRTRWNDGQRRHWQQRLQQGHPRYGNPQCGRPGAGLPGTTRPPRWNGGLGGRPDAGVRPQRPDGQGGFWRPRPQGTDASPWRGREPSAGHPMRGPDRPSRSWGQGRGQRSPRTAPCP